MICSEKKEKKDGQTKRRKVREENRLEEQANSQLAQIKFFI